MFRNVCNNGFPVNSFSREHLQWESEAGEMAKASVACLDGLGPTLRTPEVKAEQWRPTSCPLTPRMCPLSKLMQSKMKLEAQLDHRLARKPDNVHQAQSATLTVNEWKHSLSASWRGGWSKFTRGVVYHNLRATRVVNEKNHFPSTSYTRGRKGRLKKSSRNDTCHTDSGTLLTNVDYVIAETV